MDSHPTGDLAEMTLMTELMKLQAGMFKTKADRDLLVTQALASAAILEREGSFSRGPDALAEIVGKLRSL